MRRVVTLAALLAAGPAFAASGPFFSLGNSNFVVLLAFLLFIGVLIFFDVPGMLMKHLDERSAKIRQDLDEARALREEAQSILADFERKSKEVEEQAASIVAQAKTDAEAAATEAKAELERSIARRLKSAEDQIASAEAGAVKEVRDRAILVATAAARDVIAKGLGPDDANALIESSIQTVDAKLH